MTGTRALLSFLSAALAVQLAVAGARAVAGAAEKTQPPNFVVILTDDQSWVGSSLRIDPEDPRTLSDYYRTPNIERLAQLGMSFTQGYAPAPFCCPTRRSLVIGQTPARHIYQKDQPGWADRYRQQLSLPSMLKAADPNYKTAHFGKWDARFDNVTPEQMGYDFSDGLTGNSTGGSKGSGGPAAKDDPKLIFDLTRRTSEFIEKQARAGNPFFVQVSHYAVHLDIFYRQQSLEAAIEWKRGEKHTMPEFAAMTTDVDDGIGRLIDKIHSLGLDQETYIFFLSDNGGRLTMPGQQGKSLDRNHPLRDGKGSMYEGGIRVPFIVCGPGIEPGSLSRVAVTGLDIFPTIAQLAGYSKPLPKQLDGGSMLDVLRNRGVGRVKRNAPFLVFHQAVARNAKSAIIQGDFKLVKTWAEDRVELFNLAADLGEQHDLSERLPRKRDHLHQSLEHFLDDVGAETRKTTTKDQQKTLFSASAANATGDAGDDSTVSTVPLKIAGGGGLKMLYDNRAYPHAVTIGDTMYYVWRGHEGFPYIATCDLTTRRLSPPRLLVRDLLDEIDKDKYARDHHYAPVVWTDLQQHIHVLFGCHGGNKPGIHLISRTPNSIDSWDRLQAPWRSISYPKVHRVDDNKTLIYYRHMGHLGNWQYQLSDDGGRTWNAPVKTVDFNALPHDTPHASHAGSYNTTAVSADGKTLHIALIWKVEDPLLNRRYGALLHDHTQRYNLYYLSVDLQSGNGHDIRGRRVDLPLRKRIADQQSLVWDTDERVAAVGPAIALGEDDRPHLFTPVSDDTPLRSTFHHITFDHGTWRRTPVTTTLHPFNASHLEYRGNGRLRAYVIAGQGVDVEEKGMDEYGWGQRVEIWESLDDGNAWRLRENLSTTLPHQKYQNVQFVSKGTVAAIQDMILFYGWTDQDEPGTAYLWDGRQEKPDGSEPEGSE